MENSSVYTQLEVLWYHTLPFEDSLDRSYYIWTLERNLQTCENRTHGTDSSQIYGNIYSYTDGLPASTKYVQTHVFFKGFEWWIAEGYSGAAWEASVLQWSRAETFGCCVWGSKPAAWIVCNRERRWNVFCLDSTKMYFSVQSVHHTSYHNTSLMIQFVIPGDVTVLCCTYRPVTVIYCRNGFYMPARPSCVSAFLSETNSGQLNIHTKWTKPIYSLLRTEGRLARG